MRNLFKLIVTIILVLTCVSLTESYFVTFPFLQSEDQIPLVGSLSNSTPESEDVLTNLLMSLYGTLYGLSGFMTGLPYNGYGLSYGGCGLFGCPSYGWGPGWLYGGWPYGVSGWLGTGNGLTYNGYGNGWYPTEYNGPYAYTETIDFVCMPGIFPYCIPLETKNQAKSGQGK